MRTALPLFLTAAIVLRAASVCGSPAPQDAAKNIQPSPALATALAKPEATPRSATAATVNAAATATNAGAMSNEDVLALVDADLHAAVIVAKIRGARAVFDTRPDTLAQLKSLGVSDEILKAMIGDPVGAAGGQQPQPPAALKDIKLPAGTRVELEMAHTIDSQTTRTNDLVSFRVVNPVMVDGVTVIAVGATATARVVKAERNGHFGRAGRIAWELQEVTAADGTRVPLASAGRAVGDSKGAKVAATMALAVLSPFALAAGFKRGENAVVPEGKRFDAVTRAEAVVNAPSRR